MWEWVLRFRLVLDNELYAGVSCCGFLRFVGVESAFAVFNSLA